MHTFIEHVFLRGTTPLYFLLVMVSLNFNLVFLAKIFLPPQLALFLDILFLEAIMNESVSMISFSVSFLLAYRKHIYDFHNLILYVSFH